MQQNPSSDYWAKYTKWRNCCGFGNTKRYAKKKKVMKSQTFEGGYQIQKLQISNCIKDVYSHNYCNLIESNFGLPAKTR